jgi:hypothetical protein
MERGIVVLLDSELEAALADSARRLGVTPEVLAQDVLRERLLSGARAMIQPQPRDEWERRLLEAATDCGVSLPDSALGSNGLYES